MNFKHILAITFATALIIILKPDNALAQANTGNGGNFGIGVMIGEPTGISIKSWQNSSSAFALGAAWSLAGNEALHLHGDYLRHVWFRNVDHGGLAFYFGLGARVIFDNDAELGMRVPLGLNYVFEDAPFDLFVEAVPIMNLTPSTDLAGNGAAGIRFYF